MQWCTARADMTKEEFVKEVTDGLLPPPGYFPMNVALNKRGYDSIDRVMERGTQALSPEAFEAAANETEAVMLDIRSTAEFVKRHIPRSTFTFRLPDSSGQARARLRIWPDSGTFWLDPTEYKTFLLARSRQIWCKFIV